MSRQEEFAGRILFLEGYDLHIARRLVSGVDVWLNNPVHPLEASGTSGMKAGMNGVHQPLDPRRLVGRGLRRRERLGDQAGLARARPAPPRPRRGAHPLRDPAGPRHPALLRPHRGRLLARRAGCASPSARWPRCCRATTPRACWASTSPSTTSPPRARAAAMPQNGYERGEDGVGLEGERARRLERRRRAPARLAARRASSSAQPAGRESRSS